MGIPEFPDAVAFRRGKPGNSRRRGSITSSLFLCPAQGRRWLQTFPAGRCPSPSARLTWRLRGTMGPGKDLWTRTELGKEMREFRTSTLVLRAARGTLSHDDALGARTRDPIWDDAKEERRSQLLALRASGLRTLRPQTTNRPYRSKRDQVCLLWRLQRVGHSLERGTGDLTFLCRPRTWATSGRQHLRDSAPVTSGGR